jgi:hypothetical protein
MVLAAITQLVKDTDMMNIKKKKAFIILMAVIGCLIFNSNLIYANDIKAKLSAVGDGLVSLAVTTNNLLTDTLSSRMTSIEGRIANPFVHAIYGHSQNNISPQCSYKDDTYGFALGVDKVWTFANEEYFDLGISIGNMHESVIARFDVYSKNLNMNTYTVRLFGAYESFDDKCLKTNFGVILGYNYGKDKFSIFKSNGVSLRMEFIKNLYAYNGYQFGLWLRSDYNWILQYVDGGDIDFGFIHNFLATVFGLNVEKKTAFEHVDKELTLSLKTGWECRVMQHINFETFKFRYPLRNAAIVSFGASQRLNNHWNIIGSYSARFNKSISVHSLSCGIEYAF